MTSPASDHTPRRRRRRGVTLCAREGCLRPVRRESDYDTCSLLCTLVKGELDRAENLSRVTGDTDHWLAAVGLSEALTEYNRSHRRLKAAAYEVGISDEAWSQLVKGESVSMA